MDNNLLLTANSISNIKDDKIFNSCFDYDITLPNKIQTIDDLILLNSEISDNEKSDKKIKLINLDDIISLDRSNTIDSNDMLLTKFDTSIQSNIIDIFQQKQENVENEKYSEITSNNILNWDSQYIKYYEIENLCNININYIINIKNNLINLLGYHEKDDIIFYQSIINNSIFYLSNSLKIRKLKFLKDLNNIWLKINDNNKYNKELNHIYFQSLLKDYKKISDEINISKKSHKTLYWIKNDKIKNLQEFENLFTEILQYHLKLINSLLISINHEKNFYCNT